MKTRNTVNTKVVVDNM